MYPIVFLDVLNFLLWIIPYAAGKSETQTGFMFLNGRILIVI